MADFSPLSCVEFLIELIFNVIGKDDSFSLKNTENTNEK